MFVCVSKMHRPDTAIGLVGDAQLDLDVILLLLVGRVAAEMVVVFACGGGGGSGVVLGTQYRYGVLGLGLTARVAHRCAAEIVDMMKEDACLVLRQQFLLICRMFHRIITSTSQQLLAWVGQRGRNMTTAQNQPLLLSTSGCSWR